jgi:pimeloyl-ACP methyl ester carboxylesterase
MSDRPVPPPSPALLALEQFSALEFGAFLASSPFLAWSPRGDHHPVLVLPGFTGSDRSTAPLRSFLRGQGYWVHGWRLGRNAGPTRAIVDGIDERLQAVHRQHGEKVSLVGWSLGGIYARELARHHPDAVRQVITLGSPFRLREGDSSNASFLADRLARQFVPLSDDGHVPEDDRAPLAVPTTNIYSRTDGVVRWHACIDAEGPRRENVEVRGSHSGLGHNPAALLVIANRLAQRAGTWAPFRAPRSMAHLFPAPVWHEERRARPLRSVA